MSSDQPNIFSFDHGTGKNDKPVHQYSIGEEIASAILHGAGAIGAAAGLAVMLVFAGLEGNAYKIAAAIIFGVSMLLEYTASTLYHALTHTGAKRVFKILDHAAIYLLIAGTYTPFCLVTIRDAGGITLLAVIWSLALVGIAAEAFWVFRPKWVSVAIYLAMGWMIVFSFSDLTAALHPNGLYLLVAGGLAYTLGTVFYVFKRLPYLHAIWHLWVLAGTVLHYFAVLLYVVIWG